MSQIAGLLDFREQGPPADLGTFQAPASVTVYRASFSGVNYICAARFGDRGWVLISYLPLTGANATTVINAALAALTAGRTWKEKVFVIGIYSDLGQLIAYSYTILEVHGRLTARVDLNTSLIVNNDPAGGNIDIEICGGIYDMNRLNQTGDCSTIFLNNVDYPWVHHCRVFGGRRTVSVRGEGIEFYNCRKGIIANNQCHEADHDTIKLRYNCSLCTVANNTCISGNEPQESSGIQFGAGVADCVAFGNTVDCQGGVNARGMKLHNVSHNIYVGNTILNTGIRAIDIITAGAGEVTSGNIILGNIINNNNTAIGILYYGPGSIDRNVIMGNVIRRATTAIYLNGAASASNIGNSVIGNKIIAPVGVSLSYGIRYDAAGAGEAVISDNWIGGTYNGTEQGIYLSAADHNLISNNHIRYIGGTGTQAAILLTDGCDYNLIQANHAYHIARFGITIRGTVCSYNKISDNHIIDVSTGISLVGAHTYTDISLNFVITAVWYGVSLATGADYTWVHDNTLLGCASLAVYTSAPGANTYVYQNKGWITENIVLSPTFLIDAVALRTVTIPHGLNVTPGIEDCQLTVVEETDVDDWAYNLLKVDNVGAANVVAKINVSTASATGGATARLALLAITALPNKPGGY